MIPQRIIEGTGEEIAKYTHEHPNGRFKLIVLSDEEGAETATQTVEKRDKDWEELMEFVHSLKGLIPVLPLEATSTEALYD